MNDDIRAAAAANRDIANSSASPLQDCRDVVHIAIFFDGTGNNNEKDTAAKKWSNVGRIFEAAYSEPAKAVYLSQQDERQCLADRAGLAVEQGMPQSLHTCWTLSYTRTAG